MSEHIRWPSDTAKGYMEAEAGDGLVMLRPHRARGTVQKKTAPTLTCARGGGTGVVVSDLRIRYLTPRECLRLMGQTEEAIDRVMEVETSKTQLYHMAGNSIVVDVLVDIFDGIYNQNSFRKSVKRLRIEDYT